MKTGPPSHAWLAGWGLVALCGLSACRQPTSVVTPAPVSVAFLDRVKLYQPSGAEAAAAGTKEPIPRYLPDIPLRLRIEPLAPSSSVASSAASSNAAASNSPPSSADASGATSGGALDAEVARHCDPLASGAVHLKLTGPGGDALNQTLPLKGSWAHAVSAGGLAGARDARGIVLDVPAKEPGTADSPPIFRFPATPGLWTLSLTTRCARTSTQIASEEPPSRTQTWTLKVDLPPEQAPGQEALWSAARPQPGENPLALADRIEGLLTPSLSPELRLWLRKRQVQALLNAGAFVRGESAALDMAQAAEQSGFPSEQVLAFNAAHEHAREQGHLGRSLEYLRRSLNLAQSLHFEARLPMEWYAQAVLLERQGEPLQAINAAYQAAAAASLNRDNFVLEAATQLELLLLQALGYHEAVNQRLAALLAATSEDDEPRGPSQWNNLGWIMLRGVEAGAALGGDAPQALERAAHAFQQALALYQADGDLPGVQEVQANLAGLAVLQGQSVQARRWLEAAQKGGPLEGELKAWCLRVEADAFRLEHSAKALPAYQALEALGASDPGLAEYAGWGAFGQGAFWQAQALQRPAPAGGARKTSTGDRAIEAFDRALRWTRKEAAAASPLHRATFMASHAVWEEGAVLARLEQGRVAEALDVAERGAWLRFSSQTSTGTSPAADPSKLEALRQKLSSLDQSVQALYRLPPSPEQQAQLRIQQTLRETAWSELESQLRGGDWMEPPSLQLSELQARLPEGAVLLRFGVLKDRLVVWQVTRQSLTARQERLTRTQLEAQVGELTRALQKRATLPDFLPSLARTLLGEGLLETWRQAPEKPTSLFLVVDGPLRALPWGLLPVNAAGAPLIEVASPLLVPSLLLQAPMPGGQGAVVLADPGQDLPGAAREGRAVAQALEEAQAGHTPANLTSALPTQVPVTLLLQKEATRERLLNLLPTARLLHFAGHGQNDDARPYLSHLGLAREQSLSLLDLHGLRLPGSLIFVNACEVGQAARAGGGVLGLSNGLLAAGAGAVVASLWEVPDEAGFELSTRFYRDLITRHSAQNGSDTATAWSLEVQRALAETQRHMALAMKAENGQVSDGKSGSAAPAGGSRREGHALTWASWLVLGALP